MAEEQMSLDGILNDEKPAPPQAPAAEAPPPTEGEAPPPVERTTSVRQRARAKEYEAQGRDPETGQYVQKEAEAPAEEPKAAEPAKEPEKPAAPPAAPQQQFTDKERAFLAAAQSERQKRQALEAEIKALREGKPAEPAKAFWDDPEAAIKNHEQQMRDLAMATKLQTAEAIARSKYTDFDEKINEFGELMRSTPGLYQQWINSPDPADFAYRAAKSHKELSDAGSVDALRAKIEKEVRVKIEAELKAKADAIEKQRQALPPSLSDARGTKVNKPVWGGPTSLDSILKS